MHRAPPRMSASKDQAPRAALAALVLLATGLALTIGVAPTGAVARADAPKELRIVDETFRCSNYPQPVDFDLVKVTINPGRPEKKDAIHLSGLGDECTGRIGRIEVDTWAADGVKVHQEAHDLVIEGGYVRCHAKEGAVHQDGIQAMGGTRVTFRGLEVDCKTANNSAMFINQGAGGNGMPTDIVCDGCTLKKGTDRNRVLRIGNSVRSGARNSTVVWCGSGPACGGGGAVWITNAAVAPVNENNRLILHAGGVEEAKPVSPPRTSRPRPQRVRVRGPLAIERFAVTPVRAGRPFSATFVVAGAAKTLRLRCSATTRGRPLASVLRRLNGRSATCTWRAPKRRGALVTARVAVSNEKTLVRRVAGRRVLR